MRKDEFYQSKVKQFNDNSLPIKFIVLTGDLIFLTGIIVMLYHLFAAFDPEARIKTPLLTLVVIDILCYIPCIMRVPIIVHYRFVHLSRVVRRTTILCLYFALFNISVLTLTHLLPDSRAFLLSCYILLFLVIVVWRIMARKLIRAVRAHNCNTKSVLFVGCSSNNYELYYEMKQSPDSGYRVLGFVGGNPGDDFPKTATYLGDLALLHNLLDSEHPEQVFCSLPSDKHEQIIRLINYCENNLIRFYSVPNVRRYLKRKMNMELFGDVPVLYVRDEPLNYPANRILKRGFDFFCSTLFLCTIYPFMYVIIGAIIKITSPGPVYFKQLRSGENGQEFWCYKFRSMKVNGDSDKLQATKDDPRKTRFGDFLRKSNLDEFPQLINVWKGEMSMVGPRPHMLKHTDEYSQLINKYMVRHFAKPGVTGWAQVTGYRGETNELSQMEGRVKRDIWYIENWSFWLDLRIIFFTVYNMVRGDKCAY